MGLAHRIWTLLDLIFAEKRGNVGVINCSQSTVESEIQREKLLMQSTKTQITVLKLYIHILHITNEL